MKVTATRSKPALKPGEIAIKISLNFESEQLEESITEITANVSGFRTVITDLLVE